MPVIKKPFSFIEPIFFTLQNEDNNLINNEIVTSQGLDLVDYEVLSDASDQKIKNSTVNILTKQKKYQDFLTFGSNLKIERTDLNTRLQFTGLGDGYKNNTLNAVTNLSLSASNLYISNEVDVETQYFNIDFINDEFLSIRLYDGEFVKYLCTNKDYNDVDYKTLSFKTILTDSFEAQTSAYLFNYNYDKENNYLTLSQIISTVQSEQYNIITPLSGNLYAQRPTLSGFTNGVIKLSNNFNNVKDDFLHTFTTYEVNSGKYEISSESLTGIESNFLCNYAYEVTSLSGNKQKIVNVLNLFNLKNEVSHGNYINGELPFKDKSTERRYTSILNENTQSQDSENLMFGYNFYTKEYLFTPDKYTAFTLPDSLFPFNRLNINDTSLADRGSYAALSPYFSDKVFKKVDRNKNVNNKTRVEGALFTVSDLPINLQDSSNVLQLQDIVFDTVNNGTVLCSWLSGDEKVKGTWYDRYYLPQSTSYTTALTGTGVPIFDNIRQALSFFDNNGIKDTYYDVKSNLSFEPKSTLYYQRIGHNYINETINNFDKYLVKNTFNNILSGQEIQNSNILNFESNSYDYIDVDAQINNNQFNVSFDLNLDTPTSLDSYQIFGNHFEDGFTLKNNFYFTPFVYMVEGNKLYVYDSNFNLIQTNTYPTITNIKDLLYLEQGSNFVIISDDIIIKSSFTGRVLDERRAADIDEDQSANAILSGYKSRYIYDYNQVIFNMDGPKSNYLNLNSLQVTTSATSDTQLDLGNTVLKVEDSFKSIPGAGAVKLTNDIAVSLSAVAIPGVPLDPSYYNNINYIDMQTNESLYNPISAIDKKIYSLESYDERLYVQSFDNTDQGYIHIFDTTRELITSFSLNVSATSGYCLDFINDDRQLRLLSFSRQADETIIVDKIDISNFSILSTYSLPITGDNYTYGGSANFISPVNFKYLTEKYSKYQNKLCFQFNVDNFLRSILFDPLWNSPGLNKWKAPGFQLSGWDAQNYTKTLQSIDEDIFVLPYTDLNNSISLDFNFDAGIINIYWNGESVKQVNFQANLVPNTKILFPDLYFNTPNISRTPINDFINTNQFYGKGGNIENVRLYNRNLKNDLIQYLYLKDQPIDDINFDITCGTRSGTEELHNLYTFIIPGRKNNSLKVYIKNGYFSKPQQDNIKQFLLEKLDSVLPQTVDSITFNFDVNT